MKGICGLLVALAVAGATATVCAQGLSIKPAELPKAQTVEPQMIRGSCVRPEYPWASIQNKEEGFTKVNLRVNDQGAVTRSFIERSSGFVRLDKAAKEALTQCRFEPARDGQGNAVFGTARIDYPWRLDDAPKDPWVALRALRGGDWKETVDFSAIPFAPTSAASAEQRIKILQGAHAAARKNAGCASVESVLTTQPGADPGVGPVAGDGSDGGDGGVRIVREVWTLRQCGHVMQYALQMFFPDVGQPSYSMLPLIK